MLLGHSAVPIDDAVFTTLLDNSVAGTYKAYERALQRGSIKYSDLVDLARKGDIPYTLFFAPIALVREQVEKKTAKLLAGVSRDTFSIGSGAKVELRDVELIVKDLIRKQQLVRKHDSTLRSNNIIGLLRDDRATVEADAAVLMSALGLTHARLHACRTKEAALDLMIEASGFPDVAALRDCMHPTTPRVLYWVTEIMATVSEQDTRLIDLYANRGNADPLVVACALERREHDDQLLMGLDWVVVTADEAVREKAEEFGLTVSNSEFSALVDETMTAKERAR